MLELESMSPLLIPESKPAAAFTMSGGPMFRPLTAARRFAGAGGLVTLVFTFCVSACGSGHRVLGRDVAETSAGDAEDGATQVSDAADSADSVQDGGGGDLGAAEIGIDTSPDTVDISPSADVDAFVTPDEAGEVDEVSFDIAQPDVLPAPCTATSGCNDGDPCTIDSCGGAGCVHAVNPECKVVRPACDALNPCQSGVCDAVTRSCVQCLVQSDCGPGFACEHKKCMLAQPCVSDAECAPIGQVCDYPVCVDCFKQTDCGPNELCVERHCVHSQPCKSGAGCPVACNSANGKCVECLADSDCTPDAYCDSTNRCSFDVCKTADCGKGGVFFACKSNGSGYEAAKPCDDGNSCTLDECKLGGCTASSTKATCDDGNKCTTDDKCASGKCVGSAVACDDKNPCTTDFCSPKSGCVFAGNLSGSCDDGSNCTNNDKCAAGVCTGVGLNCDDGNSCTVDSCDSAMACVHVDLAGPCDLTIGCTVGNACEEGSCVAGAEVLCDDGNPCTADNCLQGCEFPSLPDGSYCSDGDSCTIIDSCVKGVCAGGTGGSCDDFNSCTADSCVSPDGYCKHAPLSGPCADSNPCTSSDTCKGGLCVPGPQSDCDDGNPCTSDGPCDLAKGGCSFSANNAAACVTGSACTVKDHCAGGKCVGQGVDCDDGEPCTTDWCDPMWGCQHVAVPGC